MSTWNKEYGKEIKGNTIGTLETIKFRKYINKFKYVYKVYISL